MTSEHIPSCFFSPLIRHVAALWTHVTGVSDKTLNKTLKDRFQPWLICTACDRRVACVMSVIGGLQSIAFPIIHLLDHTTGPFLPPPQHLCWAQLLNTFDAQNYTFIGTHYYRVSMRWSPLPYTIIGGIQFIISDANLQSNLCLSNRWKPGK